jgi:hypothetical protein
VPAEIVLCPYCKHNPRGVYLRPRFLLGIIGALALAVFACAALNPSAWVNALSVHSTPTSTATAKPTRVITLLVTATPAPSAMPKPTGRPTDKPAPTLNPTDTPTPTATKRVVKPLPALTATPAPTSLQSPILLAPANAAKLYGPKKNILLYFKSDVTLHADEWFRIEVIFKDREFKFANWCGWSKDSFIQFPWTYYEDSWQGDRAFHWHVSIAQSQTDSPSTCAASATDVSPPSAEWTFYWY